MKVLIGCEYSGIVRDAFTAAGHDATSCDLLPTETKGQHYQGNIFDIIGEPWDMMIAHPPCKYLSYAAAGHWNEPGREQKRIEALQFFCNLYDSNIPKIALENPISYAQTWRPYDQLIKPWQFGNEDQKNVALWLKNLPPLIHTVYTMPKIYAIKKDGRKMYRTEYLGGKKSKERAQFFTGIAEAMAVQWGTL